MPRLFKKTKILATIGPASDSEEMLTRVIDAGANVIRLNFSHGTQEEHGKRIALVRKISKMQDKPIGIVQDLQGPKIRLGNLNKKIHVKRGDVFRLTLGETQTDETLPIQTNIFPYLQKGHAIFINDGIVHLHVDEVGENFATATAMSDGDIDSHKGINLPHTILPGSSLTQKDEDDLAFGIRQDIDFIALSFIQSEQDIFQLREKLPKEKQIQIIAKIESSLAIKHLEKIIQATDVVMIARGDLAVEVGQEEVPLIQRRIIDLCRQYAKPVIVATQMLESMTSHAEPTRAEVNDVATAVLDKVDAVMLSAESAYGNYPVEAVAMMDKIIRRIENHTREQEEELVDAKKNMSQVDAISLASVMLANTLSAKMIFSLTESGSTARELSRFRPTMPIIALSDNTKSGNQLSLVWGVKCLHVPTISDNQNALHIGIEQAKNKDILSSGDRIVFVGGTHPGVSGHINDISVETIV